MKKNMVQFLKMAIFFLGLVALWEAVYLLHFWPSWLFPSPQTVMESLISNFRNGALPMGTLVSMERLSIGFGISLLIGTIVGFLIAKIKLFKETVGILLLGLQTLPSIAWLPLAILWFGLNDRAIIFVIVIGSVVSITISVESAVKNIPPAYINVGKLLGAKGFDSYRYVIFPAIMPSYITAIKQGWSFAWRALMAGEMLFITVGLGQLLMFGRELNDMGQVIAVMLVIIVIGVIFDQFVFGLVEKRIRIKWGLYKKEKE